MGLALEANEIMARTWVVAERLADPHAAFGVIAKDCTDLGALDSNAVAYLVSSAATLEPHDVFMKRFIAWCVGAMNVVPGIVGEHKNLAHRFTSDSEINSGTVSVIIFTFP